MNPTPKLLLNRKDAAAALSISERKLWDMTKSGEIPFLKIGRAVRYDVDQLRTGIAAQQTEAFRERVAQQN